MKKISSISAFGLGAGLLITALLTTIGAPAASAAQQCPEASTLAGSDAYKDGFDSSCRFKGFVNNGAAEGGATYVCRAEVIPHTWYDTADAADDTDWVSGCTQGWNTGQQAMNANLAARNTTLSQVQSKCTESALANAATANPSQKNDFALGCTEGYIRYANDIAYTGCSSGSGVFFEQGCSAGRTVATNDALAARNLNASDVTSKCQAAYTGPAADKDGMANDPFVILCTRGYESQANGFTKTDLSACGAASLDAVSRRACEKGFDLAAQDLAGGPSAIIGPDHVVPACDPSLPPNTAGSCDVNKFIELIKNVIAYLMMVAFPIAALMIAWGGFQVMTAAGNAEKMSAGWKSMRITAIGLVIMLLAYFIVRAVFVIMGVDETITNSIFGGAGIY